MNRRKEILIFRYMVQLAVPGSMDEPVCSSTQTSKLSRQPAFLCHVLITIIEDFSELLQKQLTCGGCKGP